MESLTPFLRFSSSSSGLKHGLFPKGPDAALIESHGLIENSVAASLSTVSDHQVLLGHDLG